MSKKFRMPISISAGRISSISLKQTGLHYHSLRECRETGKPVRKVPMDIFWYSLMAYLIRLTL